MKSPVNLIIALFLSVQVCSQHTLLQIENQHIFQSQDQDLLAPLSKFFDEEALLSDTYNSLMLQSLASLSFESAEHRSRELLSYLVQHFAHLDSDLYWPNIIMLLEQNEMKEALHYFRKLPAKEISSDSEKEMLFGYTLFATKNFQEAQLSFERLRNSENKYSTTACYYSGMCSYYLGDFEKAAALLSQVDDVSPYDNYTPRYIAQIYLSNQKWLIAAQYIENQPENSKEKLNDLLGQCYFQLEDYQNCVIAFDNYTSQAKLERNQQFQYAYANYKERNLNKSEVLFNQLALQGDVLSFWSNYFLSTIYYDQNKPNKALAALRELMAFNKEQKFKENIIYNAGVMAYETGDYRSSLRYFTDVKDAPSYSSRAIEYIANILKRSDDVDHSIEYIETKLKADRFASSYTDLLVRSLWKAFQEGNDVLLKKRYENILKRETSQISIETATLVYGQSLLQQNQPKEALDILNTLKYPSQYEQEFNYNKAFAYRQLNQTENELKYLEKVLAENASTDPLHTEVMPLRITELLLQKKSFKQAAEYMHYYTQNTSKVSDYALYLSTYIYRNLFQKEAYLDALSTLVSTYPDSPYSEGLHMVEIEELIASGKSNLAESKLKEMTLSTSPNVAGEAYLKLALLEYNQGQIKEAIRLYKRVVEINSPNAQKVIAISALKEIYLSDIKETDAYFSYIEENTDYEISSLSKDSIQFHAAKEYYNAAEYHKAIIHLESYLNQYNKPIFTIEANYMIAESYALLKEYVASVPYYKNVINKSQNTEYQSSVKKLALIYLNNLQNYEEAKILFTQLYADESITDAIRLEIAESILFCSLKTQDKALISLYSQNIIDHPLSATELKGKCYYHKAKLIQDTDPTEAIALFSEAIRAVPLHSNIHAESSYTIAELLYSIGDAEASERQCLAAIKSAQSHPKWVAKSLLLLSEIYLSQQDYLNAKASALALKENYTQDPILLEKADNILQEIDAQNTPSSERVLEANTIEFKDINDDKGQ